MHNSLAPVQSLATHVTDRANPPMSVCLFVQLEPRGKATGPLTKSSVKFCESKEAHQFISAQTTTRLSTRCFLFVDISTAFFPDRGRLYTQTR